MKSGPPVQPGESLVELFVNTKLGAFPIALRRSLAPDSVVVLEKRILAGDYNGQPLSRKGQNLLVVSPKKAWASKLKEKNRILASEALAYLSPEGTLGFTIGTPAAVPESWVCVGQIQILPGLLAQWKPSTKTPDNVTTISNPTN